MQGSFAFSFISPPHLSPSEQNQDDSRHWRLTHHRTLLLQSITIYENCTSSFAYFQAEIARSNFKLGSLLALLGDTVAASQAIERAAEERRKVVPEDLRPADKLVEGDFEALLVYWSR
jgi:hypothetical protein